jgi:hypothetical protein
MVPQHMHLAPQVTERFTKMGLDVFRLEGRGTGSTRHPAASRAARICPPWAK